MSNRFKPSDSRSVRTQRWLLAAALLGIGVLTAALPGPLTVLQAWQTPAASVGPGLGVIDTASLLAATIACWTVLGWAGALLALAVAARLPGGIGRWALTTLRRVSPAVLRSALIAGVGASMAGGITLAGSPAQASAPASPPIAAPPAATAVAGAVGAPTAVATAAGWFDAGTGPSRSAGTAGQDAAGHGSAGQGTAGSEPAGTGLDPVPLGVDWPVSRPTGTAAAPTPTTEESASPAATRPQGTAPTAPEPTPQTARQAPPPVRSAAPVGPSPHTPAGRSGDDGRLDLDWPSSAPPAPSQPAPQPLGSRPAESGVRPAAEPGQPVSEQGRHGNGNGAGTGGQQSPGPAPATRPDDRAGNGGHGGHSGHAGASRRGGDNGSSASDGGSARSVVVRPGDSLWLIAERAIGPQRGGDPAAVDAAWREWYRTNRAVIGEDPDVILPGQRLAPPHPD